MDGQVKNAGFTLVEIVSVLIIFGILAVVVLSRFQTGGEGLFVVDAAFRHHIRYAQSRSMFSDDTTWGIRMDTANDDYWLVQAGTGQTLQWNAGKILPFGAGASDTVFNDDRIRTSLARVAMGAVSGGAGQGTCLTLLFDQFGVPFGFTGTGSVLLSSPLSDTQGLTRLTQAVTIPLSDTAGNLRSVTIAHETGFVP